MNNPRDTYEPVAFTDAVRSHWDLAASSHSSEEGPLNLNALGCLRMIQVAPRLRYGDRSPGSQSPVHPARWRESSIRLHVLCDTITESHSQYPRGSEHDPGKILGFHLL